MKIISFLSHPVFTFPLAIFLIFFKENQWEQFAIVFLLSFIFPFIIFLSLYATKKITDFDITNRKQRYKIYFATLVGLVLATMYLHLQSTEFIFFEFAKLLILAFILVVINFRIKVSIHTALVTVLCIFLVQYFESSYLVFLLVPLVGFARIKEKKHKPLEVVLGALAPIIFYLIG